MLERIQGRPECFSQAIAYCRRSWLRFQSLSARKSHRSRQVPTFDPITIRVQPFEMNFNVDHRTVG